MKSFHWDFRFRADAFRGHGLSLLGQQDVGHAIVAAGRSELRLPSPQMRGLRLMLFPLESPPFRYNPRELSV